MSLLTPKLALIHNRLRHRLLRITALFALAESCFSFGVYANNHPRLVTSSTFGISTRTSSRSLNNMSSLSSCKDGIIKEQVQDLSTSVGGKTMSSKLEALRTRMRDLHLDCYIIPTDDPHLSEYSPAAFMRRKFISGFGGSAGTAVVTENEAFLWTDSRYWNEASMQLDSSLWNLMKEREEKVPTIIEYLGDLAKKNYDDTNIGEESKKLRVGIDPFVFASSFEDEFEEQMRKTANSMDKDNVEIGELVPFHENLIDSIWGAERPPIPHNPFRVHPLEYAGMSLAEKVAKVREEMKSKGASMAVFCTLDDVAYLLNIRCMGDVDTCPVGIAYATISNDDVRLYCDRRKVESPGVQEHLSAVKIKPYEDIVEDLRKYTNDGSDNKKVWIDKSRSNLALVSAVHKKSIINSQNAITAMKACKNKQELEGMRKAHEVDGAAMAHFISWLEDRVVVQGKSVSEVEIDEVLTAYRAKQPGFLENSFPTIAGVGSNAAIIHYHAKPGNLMKYLDTSEPILLDSGGQYIYGTTDVTRTWHFGNATDNFKQVFTRVLKGNIAVDTTVFPENTPGFVLDVLARRSLWEAQQDYGHGTGHGVGAALNVHEGPISISNKFANQEGLKGGMVVSNEPGYYEDGKFGVRIENLLEIVECDPIEHTEQSPTRKHWLKFVQLTLIPIQQNLINVDMLTPKELDWLNAYHTLVFEKVSPLLEPDSLAMKWLEKSCKKINHPSSRQSQTSN